MEDKIKKKTAEEIYEEFVHKRIQISTKEQPFKKWCIDMMHEYAKQIENGK